VISFIYYQFSQFLPWTFATEV